MRFLLPLYLAICGIAVAAPPHVGLLQEATAAAKAGDTATAIARLEAVAQLRPDYPRIQLNLARFYAEAKRPADALAALQRVADMGVSSGITRDKVFTGMQDLPRFQALAAKLTTPPSPVGAVAPAELEGVTGILESVLLDRDRGIWYFGDVRNRCVWSCATPGVLVKFTSDADALDGVFKLALSPDGKSLWASTAAVGAMAGTAAPEGSRSGIVAINLSDGRVNARYPAPADSRKHLLGDFLFAADGSIFATDSFSPVIWRLPPGGTALEAWFESDDFLNLQGLAFSADGGTLYVADYSNGIWRIDVATKEKSLLVAPPNATFFGLDGLYAVPAGLLAVQNGVNPQRVLLIELPRVGSALGPTSPPKSSPATTLPEASPTRTLAVAHPAMTDLALGTVDGNHFRFIADSGWALFDPAPEQVPPARTVTILSLTLE